MASQFYSGADIREVGRLIYQFDPEGDHFFLRKSLIAESDGRLVSFQVSDEYYDAPNWVPLQQSSVDSYACWWTSARLYLRDAKMGKIEAITGIFLDEQGLLDEDPDWLFSYWQAAKMSEKIVA